MTEDPKKVFGTQDAYDQRVVLRVTQGHTGREGDPLMILGVYGPDVDRDNGISGKTVRLRPQSVEMMAAFIADYLGKTGLTIHRPDWMMDSKAKGLARVDERDMAIAKLEEAMDHIKELYGELVRSYPNSKALRPAGRFHDELGGFLATMGKSKS